METYEIGELCEECLLLPEHDNAILGIVSQSMNKHVLYHVATIIENLMSQDGLTYEEAFEHFDYNIRGSSQGDNYPMYLDVELLPINSKGKYIFDVRTWGVI
jgi:hypothetical protein